jgi:hypothetical protein
MIYIPRFQKRKRLDTRGGMSSNVPVVTPESALRADALSRVLDNVSTKLIPAIAGYMAEEKKENEKTDLLNFDSDMIEKIGEAPSDAGPNWFAENATPLFEGRIKDIDDDNLKAKMRFIFTKKKATFEANYIAKTHPKLFEKKQKNATTEFIDSNKGLDYSSAQGQKQFNMNINNYFEAATDAFMWDYEQKTGEKATKEIVDREEYKSYISKIEKTISNAAIAGVKRQVKTLASSTDTPTEKIVENLESWAKGKPLKKDKKGESPYSFLYILEDADVDKKTFVTELHKSIIDGERVQNTIIELDEKREKKERREEFDKIMSGFSETVTANVNNPSDYDTNEKKFSKLQDRLKVFLKTYPEAHKYTNIRKPLVPNAYNNLRDEYLKSLDTRTQLDSLRSGLDLLDDGNIDISNKQGLLGQLEENDIKEEHIPYVSKFLTSINSIRNEREKHKIKSLVSNLNTLLTNVDNMYSSSSELSFNTFDPNNGTAFTTEALLGPMKNQSYSKRRKKTKYEQIKIQALGAYKALINRLMSNELSNDPKANNYVGKEIRSLYYHNVYVPLKSTVKKDLNKILIPMLNKSGSNKHLKSLIRDFRGSSFEQKTGDEKDNHLDALFTAVGDHFVSLKRKEGSLKQADSDALNKSRSILTGLKLLRTIPENIAEAAKEMALIDEEVSFERTKKVASGERRNR